MTPKQAMLKKRMLRRLKKDIAELEQLIIDKNYWNEIHPHEQPLDIERERVALHLAHEFRKELIANTGDKPLDSAGRMKRLVQVLKGRD